MIKLTKHILVSEEVHKAVKKNSLNYKSMDEYLRHKLGLKHDKLI